MWAGTVTPPREGIIKRWTYPAEGETGAITLDKGEEMGQFKLGSTVINLFAAGKVQLMTNLSNQSVIRMGEPLAEAISEDAVVSTTAGNTP